MDKRERVARAIFNVNSAEKFTWETTHDLVRVQCFRMADAAIAALEPVTVQDAARVLLANMHHCKPHGTHGRPGATVEHIHFGPYALRSLRALAERG